MASKFVREAVGVDLIEERAIDANYSAELNNIHNVKFVFLKTEMKLKSVLESLNTSRDIVVIVNSGDTRIGLDVISIVRKCKQITRLVYISDKPYSQNARDNMEGLCSKKKWKARTFRLAKAIPVDLLPQTDHDEIILMFQRAPHRKYLK